jgi:hypothetical protein
MTEHEQKRQILIDWIDRRMSINAVEALILKLTGKDWRNQ